MQTLLNAQEKSITDALGGENGQIQHLKDRIKEQMNRINSDEKEWEKDTIAATTAITYAWIFPFGTIAAAVVIGVFSDKAIKMRKEINALWDMIKAENQSIDSDIMAVADISNASAQLKSLIDQLGPAIKTIQHMIGSWGSIRDDLKTISEDILSSGDHKGNSVMAEIDINGILDEWNALKAKADFFRQNAYVSQPPEKKSFEEVKALVKVDEARKGA